MRRYYRVALPKPENLSRNVRKAVSIDITAWTCSMDIIQWLYPKSNTYTNAFMKGKKKK